MATATKFIQRLRNALSGHDLQAKLQLRYGEVAKRSQPPPQLPAGPSHQYASNYYHARDGRRESVPATVVMSPQRALTAGSGDPFSQAPDVPRKRPVIPGNVPRELELSKDEPYL
ncbi:hypothetical protein CRUP_000280 [Coryphaenoides rupestris]|nr:hypothetical protein CRUP_000280 [Coryphaenoides rupestris]